MLKIIKNFFCSLVLFFPTMVFAQWSKGLERAGKSGLSQQSIVSVIVNLMNILLSFVGVLGVIAFAISGIMYLTAAGDEGRMEAGKKTMIWSITGMVVALAGVVIIRAIDAILNARGVV